MDGSKSDNEKQAGTGKHGWVKISQKEFEEIVVGLAREGKTPAQIGLVLRDKYGLPKANLLGKGVVETLREKSVKYRSEKELLDERVGRLKTHLSKNKHDYPAFNSLAKKLWAVHRAEKQTV